MGLNSSSSLEHQFELLQGVCWYLSEVETWSGTLKFHHAMIPSFKDYQDGPTEVFGLASGSVEVIEDVLCRLFSSPPVLSRDPSLRWRGSAQMAPSCSSETP